MANKEIIFPVFVPMVGCPHQCSFCNQQSITGTTIKNLLEDVRDQIKANFESKSQREGFRELAFFGGSFTCIPIAHQNIILEMARPFLKDGTIDGVRISTRPDFISDETLKNLQSNNLTTIELGIQSIDPYVLKASERGYLYDEILPGLLNLKNYGFRIGFQMMVGLDLDTRLKSIKTALEFADLKPDFVRIYPTLVVRGSKLEKQYKKGDYIPLSLDDTLGWVRDIKIIFEYHNIKVIRMGLHSQEGFDRGQDLVAGPYHPAFGEMVENIIYRGWIEEEIEALIGKGKSHDNDIIIGIHPSRLSQGIGQKRSNLAYFNNRFPKYRVIFKKDNNMGMDSIDISLDGSVRESERKTFISKEYESILGKINNWKS